MLELHGMLIRVPKQQKKVKIICKECGNKGEACASQVRKGAGLYCGCSCATIARNRTHGESKTRLYQIWRGMIRRCYEEKHIAFAAYGGSGVNVCEEWKDFLTFKMWATCNGYSDTLELDRKSGHGNYTPDNCRFVTDTEQNRNHRNNRGGTSKYKGVSWNKEIQKWVSCITINTIQKYLGRFDSEEQAAKAYDEAACSFFGEFAFLNFEKET